MLLTVPFFVVRPTAPPSVTVLVPARRPSFSASAPFSTRQPVTMPSFMPARPPMVTAGVLNCTLAFAASLTLRMVASLPLYAATAPMLSDVPVIVQPLTLLLLSSPLPWPMVPKFVAVTPPAVPLAAVTAALTCTFSISASLLLLPAMPPASPLVA